MNGSKCIIFERSKTFNETGKLKGPNGCRSWLHVIEKHSLPVRNVIMIFTQEGPMDTTTWIEDTGEPRAQKCACVVRRRAGGKGLQPQHLACGLSYFVVLHAEETEVMKAQQLIATWLQGIGLELKPSKTRLSHTLKEYQGNVGFNFLGFTIRQFPVGRTHTGTTSRGNRLVSNDHYAK